MVVSIYFCLLQVPRMQIFVRDQKVRTQRVTSLLRGKMHERFQLRNQTLAYADIEMGFNTEVGCRLLSLLRIAQRQRI